MSILKAKNKVEIIELIHPNLLEKLPSNEIDIIVENILLVEKYIRGEVNISPKDIIATRIYADGMGQIIQIDYNGIIYNIY